MTTYERFAAKFARGADTECWEWQGKRWRNGYGSFYVGDGRCVGAHRAAWELAIGPIPDGLEIDHLCRNRACVNPAHMEVVTHAENLRRARGWKKSPATHCKNGHPFDDENTRYLIRDGRTVRACRACGRERQMRHRGGPVIPTERACEVCGALFTPKKYNSRARYCGNTCGVRAWRAHQRAARAA